MKDIKYYTENKFPYPNKSDFIRFQVNSLYGGEIVHKSLTKDELIKEGFSVVSSIKKTGIQKENFIVIYNLDEDVYRAASKKYYDFASELITEFAHDLAEHQGIDPNSRFAEAIYSEAYDQGHSGGLNEIANYYDSIADFAQKLRVAREEDANLA